jgi:hypothetical protein
MRRVWRDPVTSSFVVLNLKYGWCEPVTMCGIRSNISISFLKLFQILPKGQFLVLLLRYFFLKHHLLYPTHKMRVRPYRAREDPRVCQFCYKQHTINYLFICLIAQKVTAACNFSFLDLYRTGRFSGCSLFKFKPRAAAFFLTKYLMILCAQNGSLY